MSPPLLSLLLALLAVHSSDGQVFFKGECPDPPTVVDFKLWLVSSLRGMLGYFSQQVGKMMEDGMEDHLATLLAGYEDSGGGELFYRITECSTNSCESTVL